MDRIIRTGSSETFVGMNNMVTRNDGFTLLELLIVLTLIGLLATIAVPMYNNSIVKAKESVLKEDLFVMREAIDKYYADNGAYPSDLSALKEKKYIRTVPVDPFTSSADTWVKVSAQGEEGVFDIKSGSDQSGRNGVPYAEW